MRHVSAGRAAAPAGSTSRPSIRIVGEPGSASSTASSSVRTSRTSSAAASSPCAAITLAEQRERLGMRGAVGVVEKLDPLGVRAHANTVAALTGRGRNQDSPACAAQRTPSAAAAVDGVEVGDHGDREEEDGDRPGGRMTAAVPVGVEEDGRPRDGADDVGDEELRCRQMADGECLPRGHGSRTRPMPPCRERTLTPPRSGRSCAHVDTGCFAPRARGLPCPMLARAASHASRRTWLRSTPIPSTSTSTTSPGAGPAWGRGSSRRPRGSR